MKRAPSKRAVVLVTLTAACALAMPGSAAEAAKVRIDREATVRIGQTLAATSWDPLKIGGSAAASQPFVTLVYDQLLEYGPDLKPRGMLAKDWKIADDGMSLTLNLRDDVKFHDGTKLDANVVRANLLRAKATPLFAAGIMSVVTSVTATSPTSVRIDFAAKTYNFPDSVAREVRVGSMVNPAMFDHPSLATKPAGTGPYELVSASTDSSVFERVPSHWDKTSGLAKRIELRRILDANARLNALRSDQIDISYTTLDQVNDAKAANVKLVEYSNSPAIQGVLIAYTRPAVSDWRIRKAISLAIDRHAITTAAYAGYCQPTRQLMSKVASGYIPAEDAKAKLRSDPKAAKKLLADAGITTLSLTGLVPSGNTSSITAAQLVQAQLDAIGIKLSLTTLPPAQASPAFADGEYDIQLTSMSPSPDTQDVMEANLKNRGKAFTVPDYLQAGIDRASRLPYGPARDKAWEEVNKTMLDKPPFAPLCNSHAYLGVGPNVIGAETIAYGRITQGIVDARRLGLRKAR